MDEGLLLPSCGYTFAGYLIVYAVIASPIRWWSKLGEPFWGHIPTILFILLLNTAAIFVLAPSMMVLLAFEAVGISLIHLLIALRNSRRRPPTQTGSRPNLPTTRYRCAHCSAPVPDQLCECPCCFATVPLTERAEQLLPIPTDHAPQLAGQLPRPARVAPHVQVGETVHQTGAPVLLAPSGER